MANVKVFRDEDPVSMIEAEIKRLGFDVVSFVKVIFIGNTGAGKSFLANIFIGEEYFEHAFSGESVTHVMERVLVILGDIKLLVYNVPGLIEAESCRVSANKAKLTRALTELPYARTTLVWVFGCAGGGRSGWATDIVTFHAVHRYTMFPHQAMIAICNQVGENTIGAASFARYQASRRRAHDELLVPNLATFYMPMLTTQRERTRGTVEYTQAQSIIRTAVAHGIAKALPLHVQGPDIELPEDVLERDIKKARYDLAAQQQRFADLQQGQTGEIAALIKECEGLNARLREVREAATQQARAPAKAGWGGWAFFVAVMAIIIL